MLYVNNLEWVWQREPYLILMNMVKYITLFPAALSLTFLNQCSFEYINICGMVESDKMVLIGTTRWANQEMKAILWWEAVWVASADGH